MSYGFRAINDSGYIQVDSETPRIGLLDQGTYQAVGGYVATVNFSRVITTTEPPLIFIHPNEGSNYQRPYYAMTMLGQAGAWTGFSIQGGNVQDLPAGKWLCAQWQIMATGNYGMRIFGPAGELLYDAAASALTVTFASGAWTYLGNLPLTIGSRYTWGISHLLASDEYMMINPFMVGSGNSTGYGADAAITADYAGSRILMTSTSVRVWTDQGHRPVICAKITA